MTIAISLKVNDGIVLASDSASSISARDPVGKNIGVVNVYYNADKIFNLCKGQSIGAITWGSGSIGKTSISTLVKDFRKNIITDIISKDSYTIEEVTNNFVDYVFNKHYFPDFSEWEEKPNLGFIIAGYGKGLDYAEEWIIEVKSGKLLGPLMIRGEEQIGMTWNGEPEAITRLYYGHGNRLPSVLKSCGIDDNKISEIMEKIHKELQIPMVIPPLPIQDAIDLAEYLVDLTMKFSKFSPGPTTVGGPVDIATITKHEGFKWIRRKHFYSVSLNPYDDPFLMRGKNVTKCD